MSHPLTLLATISKFFIYLVYVHTINYSEFIPVHSISGKILTLLTLQNIVFEYEIDITKYNDESAFLINVVNTSQKLIDDRTQTLLSPPPHGIV